MKLRLCGSITTYKAATDKKKEMAGKIKFELKQGKQFRWITVKTDERRGKQRLYVQINQ